MQTLPSRIRAAAERGGHLTLVGDETPVRLAWADVLADAETMAAALAARAEAERIEERALVAEFEEAMGQGWAVNGVTPTLRALARGQLKLLVVRAGQTGWGFRCAGSGRLVAARDDSRNEGEPVPVADLVNEALEEALEDGIEVVVVDDPDASAALDGIAGLLRFR